VLIINLARPSPVGHLDRALAIIPINFAIVGLDPPIRASRRREISITNYAFIRVICALRVAYSVLYLVFIKKPILLY